LGGNDDEGVEGSENTGVAEELRKEEEEDKLYFLLIS
jgi:hypothetical protein